MPYVFDLGNLACLANARHAQFGAADPYPHIVIDEILRPNYAWELARTFPRPNDSVACDHFGIQTVEVKLASAHEERFQKLHRQALHDLNSGRS